MNKLSILLIIIIVVALTSESFAQTFGVRAGLNLSNMVIKDGDEEDIFNDMLGDKLKTKSGFHLGVTGEFLITEILSLETGFLLSTKGFVVNSKEELMGETLEIKGRTNLYYLDIPLTAKASFDAGGIEIFGIFGPYVGIGVSGKIKSEGSFMGKTETEEEDVIWGSDEDDFLKRLDFGLTMGAGIEINSIQILLSYGLGIANISPYNDNSEIHNRVVGISLGYKFNKK